jgi:hypothetical protein
MCADSQAPLPREFYGQQLFRGESTDAEGLAMRPTFFTSPSGDVVAFGRSYRQMEELLEGAAAQIAAAEPLVPERCRLMFRSEACPIRWFYRTVCTHANFYESCQLRDRLSAFAAKPISTGLERAKLDYERWRQVLINDRQNTIAALPIMEEDMRLNFRYGGDHTYEEGPKVLRAKLLILDHEINEFLPGLWRKCQ